MSKGAWVGLLLGICGCLAAPAQEAILSGRVVDPFGEPVEGVTITLGRLPLGPLPPGVSPENRPRRDVRRVRGVTDADGKYVLHIGQGSLWYGDRFVIQCPEPDLWMVTAGVQKPDVITSGRMTETVVRRLDQQIAGQVVDDQGRPVPGAAVGAPEYYGAWVQADARGQFTLPNVPTGPSTIVALAGPDWRAVVQADGGATDVSVPLAPMPAPDPEADRALAYRLLNEAFDLARQERDSSGASNTWLEVSVAMQKCDTALAWSRVATFDAHWMRDRARIDMLANAVELAPDWAVGLLDHLSEIADPDIHVNGALLLALQLRSTHPKEAEKLYRHALDCPAAGKSEFNAAQYQMLLTAAMWAFGQTAEADQRVDQSKAAARLPEGLLRLYVAHLGWHWYDHPEALEMVLAVVSDETMRQVARVRRLQHLSRADPLAAAQLLTTTVPDLDRWLRLGKFAQTQPEYDLARAVEQCVNEIGMRLMLADPVAGEALLQRLTPACRIEILGRTAARTAEPQQQRKVLDQAWSTLRTALRARDELVNFNGKRLRVFAVGDADGRNVAPELEARLRRLEWRLGQTTDPLPADWTLREASPRVVFYHAAVDPNGAWLNLQPRLHEALRDTTSLKLRSYYQSYARALVAASPEAAAAFAGLGTRQGLGAQTGNNTGQIKALCIVGQYLLAPPEERWLLPYDFNEFESAFEPYDRPWAW